MKFRIEMPLLALATLGLSALAAHADPTLSNGGFEGQLEGWKLQGDMAALSTEQAATGKTSLKITDADEKTGSDVLAARVPVQAGVYTLQGKVFPGAINFAGVSQRGEKRSAAMDKSQAVWPSPSSQLVTR